jgi:phosphatidylserine/phosphatidylglycerophosphate/cardiolipin synthase-like enzyme
MIEFVNAPGAVHRIQELIDDAESFVILVSPFLKVAPNIIERIHGADRRGVKVVITYGKEEKLAAEVEKLLADVENLTLRYYQDLHAKCYANEKGMVITSMNLYEFSQRNREMGVYVTAEEEVYNKAIREVRQILDYSQKKSLSKVSRIARSIKNTLLGSPPVWQSKPRQGVCIRCAEPRRVNPNSPLCDHCYNTWAFFGNADFPERFCHSCGEEADTSYARPLCRPCFRARRAA